MKIEIWIEFASTYSHLTVWRAPKLLEAEGVDYAWRPFLLGVIFKQKGWNSSPFVLDPVKGAHMWRDVERRAERIGAPFQRPSLFPANGLHAARIMTAAEDESWCAAFAREVFTAQFGRGEDISDQGVLAEAIARCGAEPTHWLGESRSEAVKMRLRARTEAAQARGVFGAPSFTVGEELFWGDDRLEDAIAWAKKPSKGSML
ncbi:MAG: 2-hydroxychromene-2-carboxylate isomerase [Pseudomonadota bacterium]